MLRNTLVVMLVHTTLWIQGALIAQESPSAKTVIDVATQLRALRDGLSGLQFKYRVDEAGDSNPIIAEFWLSPDCTIARRFLSSKHVVRDGERIQSSWTHKTSNLQFSVASTWLEGKSATKNTTYNAYNLADERKHSSFLPVPNAFGYDEQSGYYWDEIILDPLCQVESGKLPSTNGEWIRGTLSGVGVFEFHFVRDANRLNIVSVSAQKKSSDLTSEGSPIVAYHLRMDSIKYSAIAGRHIMSSWQQVRDISRKLGDNQIQELHQESRVRLESANVLTSELDSRIEFPNVEIPDGTPVKVHNDKGIPYQYYSGRLVRVIDSDSYNVDSGSRFRKPESFGAAYRWALILIGMLVVVVFVLARKSHK